MSDNMDSDLVRFYYSFNDPYSFLTTAVASNLGKSYRISVEYIALAGFDRQGLFSQNNAVSSYWTEDMMRFAAKAGRNLTYDPAVMDSSKACLGRHLADEKMLGVKYMNLVFAMRWLNAGNIEQTSQLIEGLKYLELDKAELAEALDSDKYVTVQAELEEQALEQGVIGTPFFTFRGMRFFGAQRVEDLEKELAADPDLKIHHDANYSVIKVEQLEKMLAENKPALVLDVRIPKDFGQAHIPGANCLPAKIVNRNIGRLGREQNIIVVDDDGIDAPEIAFMLASEGFKNVSVLKGGFPAWKGDTKSGLDEWQDKLKPR